ncbi:MAG: hypothetical protein WBA46_01295 [Thermomicrobiales bacterium]
MSSSIEFTGTVRHGKRHMARVLTLRIGPDALRVDLDPLLDTEPMLTLVDPDPAVRAWAMRLLVELENQEARILASPALHTVIAARREATRQGRPLRRCPECDGMTTIDLDDRLIDCPRCEGAGAI